MTLPRAELIYIHGFASSTLSQKAEATREYIDRCGLPVVYRCPQLSAYPSLAVEVLEKEIAACTTPPVLIGSSMGGFYATYFTETLKLKSVLVNPAVAPDRLMAEYLGPNTNPYTGEEFSLTERDLERLVELDLPVVHTTERSLVLLETGDETLDYRDALSHYEGVPTIVEQGGDHRFQSYERYLPLIFDTLLPVD